MSLSKKITLGIARRRINKIFDVAERRVNKDIQIYIPRCSNCQGRKQARKVLQNAISVLREAFGQQLDFMIKDEKEPETKN